MIWQLEVYAPDGSLRTVLGQGSAVDDVWWSTRGDGDCLEAVVRGVGLDLRPREIVAIRASETDAPLLPYVYWGWVIAAPGSRSKDVTDTRLVGGGMRLRELINTWSLITNAGDVARFAQLSTTPPGTSGGEAAPRLRGGTDADAPDLGFSLGNRRPRSELIAESLDALAETCPEFVVEPDSTYEYDGETFDPGDTVPAVTWGAKAVADVPAAVVFFRRPLGLLELDEVDDALHIDWEPITAEAIVDRVRVVLFDEPSAGAVDWHSNGAAVDGWVAVAHTVVAPAEPPPWSIVPPPTAKFFAAQVLQVPPLDYLKRAAWGGSSNATGVSNAANAYDTNEASYASNTGNIFVMSRDMALTARAVRVRYSSHVPVIVRVYHHADLPPVIARHHTVQGVLPTTDGQQSDVWLLAPVATGVPGPGRVRVELTASTKEGEEPALVPDGLRVYTIEPLEPDLVAMRKAAQSHLRLPAEFSALVTVPNRLVAPLPRIELSLADESSVSASADTFEYAINREGGLTTWIRLNQAMAADDESERRALTARFEATERRAVALAKRSRP